jgi:hypothetical protein
MTLPVAPALTVAVNITAEPSIEGFGVAERLTDVTKRMEVVSDMALFAGLISPPPDTTAIAVAVPAAAPTTFTVILIAG